MIPGDSWPERSDKDEYDEDFYEQEKPVWKKNEKLDSCNISNSEDKVKKEPPETEPKYSNSDDDLNALLKEEEDLVNAHRKHVEETMDIVREAPRVAERVSSFSKMPEGAQCSCIFRQLKL